jgi:hypothetical protein
MQKEVRNKDKKEDQKGINQVFKPEILSKQAKDMDPWNQQDDK